MYLFIAIHPVHVLVWHFTVKTIVEMIGLHKVPFLLRLLQSLKVFTLYTASGVFFRANNVDDAFYFFSNCLSGISQQLSAPFIHFLSSTFVGNFKFLVIGVIFIAILEFFHFLQEFITLEKWFFKQNKFFRWGSYYLIFTIIILFGNFSGIEFVYFQF